MPVNKRKTKAIQQVSLISNKKGRCEQTILEPFEGFIFEGARRTL